MERKHIPETENRLIILYTLRRLGPVTAMQLLQAMAESDLMNYITMQLALSDMEEQGQLTQRAHPLGNLIEVTGEGDFILRFMTSHPKDATRKLIDVMASSKHIARQFHLPMQSGSDTVLKAMNRHYDTAKYLDTVKKLYSSGKNLQLHPMREEPERGCDDIRSMLCNLSGKRSGIVIYGTAYNAPFPLDPVAYLCMNCRKCNR